MPKKNEKKKLKSHSRQSKRREPKKKIKKKTVPSVSLWPTDTCQAKAYSRHLKRREWGKGQKKKIPKMKVGHFGNFFSKGVRLEIFLGNRVGKKKIQNLNYTKCY